MSFLKNLRSSVSRKQNETSSARRSELSGDNTRRSTRSLFSSRKIEEQQSDGLVRSETFTVDQQESIFVRGQNVQRQSMFGRFSTFTKKKKGKESKQKIDELKNENLSSSYKRYPTPSDVVSSGNDPFHYLYDRGSPTVIPKTDHSKKTSQRSSVDYGTYRKGNLPVQVLDKLEEGRSISEPPKSKHESARSKEKRSDSEDKYKTVTINSFRKSFRERFLKGQKDVPYNPAWFVEVEAPKTTEKDVEDGNNQRRDLLVFENDQYRPTARSPIRQEYKSPTRQTDRSPTRHAARSPTRRSRSPGRSNRANKGHSPKLSPIRSSTRSPVVDLYDRPKPQPVKRNETFKIDRENNEPSIRIEIKNSIIPSDPGRIVPVGVARPMPSPVNGRDPKIIQKRWTDPDRQNLYQTCIQITDARDDSNRYLRDRNPNSQIYQQVRSRKATTSSGPIITNFSPLKSYELLSKINRRDEVVARERPRAPPQNAQLYDNKRWPAAPTYSSHQKISAAHTTDKMVRREPVTNNIRNGVANSRRPAPIKTPWR